MIHDQLLKELQKLDRKLPHGSNLRTKLFSSIKKNDKNKDTLINIANKYLVLLKKTTGNYSIDSLTWIKETLIEFESYYKFLKLDINKKFSHQSDFLSSLIPEYLYLTYNKWLTPKFDDIIITTQKDIIIDLSFLPYEDKQISFKEKRVDVAIVKKINFELGNQILDFSISLVGIEVKTNLDKNMISGVEYSVERMKKTFPLSKFYLISELADFAFKKQNYASTSIDEIIILRKQKRSEVRKDKNSINPIDPNLLNNHILELELYLKSCVKAPGNLKERLNKGKLIN